MQASTWIDPRRNSSKSLDVDSAAAPQLRRKLLNGEIFVAQVYFIMFNARRAAVAEYALHFLPGPLCVISRYTRFAQARFHIAVKYGIFD